MFPKCFPCTFVTGLNVLDAKFSFRPSQTNEDHCFINEKLNIIKRFDDLPMVTQLVQGRTRM